VGEPRIEIGLREVYDKLCTVEDKVQALSPLSDSVKDHEVRMRSLERALDALQAAHRSVEKFKNLFYPLLAMFIVAIIGAIVTILMAH
jgi:hypothetical protein